MYLLDNINLMDCFALNIGVCSLYTCVYTSREVDSVSIAETGVSRALGVSVFIYIIFYNFTIIFIMSPIGEVW